jgi:hypothetical protein
MTLDISNRTSRLSTLYRIFTLPIICNFFHGRLSCFGYQTRRNQFENEEAVLVRGGENKTHLLSFRSAQELGDVGHLSVLIDHSGTAITRSVVRNAS